jgi:hypothetical protein
LSPGNVVSIFLSILASRFLIPVRSFAKNAAFSTAQTRVPVQSSSPTSVVPLLFPLCSRSPPRAQVCSFPRLPLPLCLPSFSLVSSSMLASLTLPFFRPFFPGRGVDFLFGNSWSHWRWLLSSYLLPPSIHGPRSSLPAHISPPAAAPLPSLPLTHLFPPITSSPLPPYLFRSLCGGFTPWHTSIGRRCVRLVVIRAGLQQLRKWERERERRGKTTRRPRARGGRDTGSGGVRARSNGVDFSLW